jgi:hypothetical protein
VAFSEKLLFPVDFLYLQNSVQNAVFFVGAKVTDTLCVTLQGVCLAVDLDSENLEKWNA